MSPALMERIRSDATTVPSLDLSVLHPVVMGPDEEPDEPSVAILESTEGDFFLVEPVEGSAESFYGVVTELEVVFRALSPNPEHEISEDLEDLPLGEKVLLIGGGHIDDGMVVRTNEIRPSDEVIVLPEHESAPIAPITVSHIAVLSMRDFVELQAV